MSASGRHFLFTIHFPTLIFCEATMDAKILPYSSLRTGWASALDAHVHDFKERRLVLG